MMVLHATSDRQRVRDVELRVVQPGARRVEIAGEMDDWLAPRVLEQREPGVFARRFRLPEGAYAYKLKVDGAWELDEGNPRTRASGPFRNNVLAVGGAEEPLLFAPGCRSSSRRTAAGSRSRAVFGAAKARASTSLERGRARSSSAPA